MGLDPIADKSKQLIGDIFAVEQCLLMPFQFTNKFAVSGAMFVNFGKTNLLQKLFLESEMLNNIRFQGRQRIKGC